MSMLNYTEIVENAALCSGIKSHCKPELAKNPNTFLAQFVCPSPKVCVYFENSSLWDQESVVRGFYQPCIKIKTNLVLF